MFLGSCRNAFVFPGPQRQGKKVLDLSPYPIVSTIEKRVVTGSSHHSEPWEPRVETMHFLYIFYEKNLSKHKSSSRLIVNGLFFMNQTKPETKGLLVRNQNFWNLPSFYFLHLSCSKSLSPSWKTDVKIGFMETGLICKHHWLKLNRSYLLKFRG